MTTSHVNPLPPSDACFEFDEAFLERVDRAGLLCKQRDPYRLDQMHHALEEEVQRVAPRAHEGERIPHRGAEIGGMNKWEAQ